MKKDKEITCVDLVKELEIIFKPDKCDHNYEIIQKKPFYIISCKKCEHEIHCTKKCYEWLKSL